jgi:hypothetical protein
LSLRDLYKPHSKEKKSFPTSKKIENVGENKNIRNNLLNQILDTNKRTDYFPSLFYLHTYFFPFHRKKKEMFHIKNNTKNNKNGNKAF